MQGQEFATLRKSRIRLGQKEMGRVLGVSHTTVSDWERGERGVPCQAALIATLMAKNPILREEIIEMTIDRRNGDA